MNQIKKNFIYNIFYQILNILLPLVTVPYISRILNADGVGIYSYTYSVVYYFMMIGMLGINNYGNRNIAKVRDDKEKLSKTFLSIYSLQVIMNIVMLFFYLLYVFALDNRYFTISLIQSIFLISNALDINWFFFGLEKFKLTVVRSTILKLISLILIFIFVKTSNDLWIYTLIMAGSTLLSQILLFSFLKKEIKFIKITLNDLVRHIKPCLILFIPVIAISLYKVMDKIMLGIISDISEVGYYEQAEKIINMPLGIITALGTVMMPRISNLISNGNSEKIVKYIEKSIEFMMFLAFPICFGLIAVSNNFVNIFLGENFQKSAIIVCLLAITILFLAFANVLRTQYLIPKERDRDYIISVISGAIINLIINILLISKYGSIGAAIGTIFAEFFVMMYQILALRKELPIKKYVIEIISFFYKSLIMFIIVLAINYLKLNILFSMILQVILGCGIYILMNIKYIKNSINF